MRDVLKTRELDSFRNDEGDQRVETVTQSNGEHHWSQECYVWRQCLRDNHNFPDLSARGREHEISDHSQRARTTSWIRWQERWFHQRYHYDRRDDEFDVTGSDDNEETYRRLSSDYTGNQDKYSVIDIESYESVIIESSGQLSAVEERSDEEYARHGRQRDQDVEDEAERVDGV